MVQYCISKGVSVCFTILVPAVLIYIAIRAFAKGSRSVPFLLQNCVSCSAGDTATVSEICEV